MCGSDVTIYNGKHKRVRLPVAMGHEVVGETAALGFSDPELRVGDRVVAEPLIVDLTALVLKDVNLVGCCAYIRPDFEAAIGPIDRGVVDTEALVSHVMPLERCQDAMELDRKGNASLKILLKPWI